MKIPKRKQLFYRTCNQIDRRAKKTAIILSPRRLEHHTHTHTHTHTHAHLSSFLRACVCMYVFLLFFFLFFFFIFDYFRSFKQKYELPDDRVISNTSRATLALAEFSPRETSNLSALSASLFHRKVLILFRKTTWRIDRTTFRHDSITDLPRNHAAPNQPPLSFRSRFCDRPVAASAWKETRSQSGGNLAFTRKRRRRVSITLFSFVRLFPSVDSLNFVR